MKRLSIRRHQIDCQLHREGSQMRASKSRQKMCPDCGSRDTISFEMAHAAHTSIGIVNALSYDFEGDVTATKATITSQSKLGERTGPPAKSYVVLRRALWLAFAAFMVSCFVLPLFWETHGTSKGLEGLCLLPFAVAALVFFGIRKLYAAEERNAEVEFRQALSDWKQRWICLRCGSEWKVAN
jgi:hypothetical protein